ncbi:MAG: DNA-binding response regulator [Cytophagales bacterium]|nr:MAG: DNA-binding response regulator [Cytophagales bacterium]
MTKPYRTILIDDHQLFSDGLKTILNDTTDFRVVEQVYDSRQAQAVCAQHKPDLVLVDFNMPNLDGLAVVRQIRQLSFPCRIVVVSMYAEPAEVARFDALHVDGYLAKSISARRLLLLLEWVMLGERVFETDVVSVSPSVPPDYFWLKYQLTRREVEILKLVKAGLSSEQMADQLSLSYHTVQAHRRNIKRKLPFNTEKQFYDFLNKLEDKLTESD